MRVDANWKFDGITQVWLDGVEVTNECFYADDVAGVVFLYVRGPSGFVRRDPETHEPLTVERHGRVRIQVDERPLTAAIRRH